MADKQDWRREDEDEGEQEIDENVSIKALTLLHHVDPLLELQGAKGCHLARDRCEQVNVGATAALGFKKGRPG